MADPLFPLTVRRRAEYTLWRVDELTEVPAL